MGASAELVSALKRPGLDPLAISSREQIVLRAKDRPLPETLS